MKMNMKKIISWGMMLAAAFTLTNCAKEIDAPVQEPESVGYPFEIVASTVDTKTVNDGMSTKWAAEDQINLFYAVGETTEYVNNNAFTIDDVAEGRFTGNLAATLDSQEEYDWYAFYPYDSHIKTPANTSTGYMPVGSKSNEKQTQTGNNSMAHIAGANYPLAGKAIAVPAGDTPNIKMSHLSSLLAINVTNNNDEPLTVTEVAFTAPVDIIGTYYINFAGEITPASFKNSGSNYVSNTATLTVKNGTALAKGEYAKFYLAVRPFTADSDKELTISVNGYSKKITLSEAVTFNAGKIKTLNFKYDKVVAPVGDNTDVLNRALTGIENGSSAYASWSGKSSNTAAVYAGQSAGSNDAIQLRSNNSNSGVVTTASAGYAKKIEVEWNTNTANGRILNVYGRSSAYSNPTELYNTSTSGTLLGTIVKGQTTELQIDGNYEFIGMRSASGAMYIDEIRVTWSSEAAETSPLASISVSGQTTEFKVGETFVFDGVVTAYYEDETSKIVAPTSVSSPDMTTAGTKTVFVSYAEGGITKEFSYSINVVKSSESWTLVKSLDEIVTGQYVVVVKTNTKVGYLPSTTTSSAPSYITTGITINGEQIASVSDDMIFTFTVTNANSIKITNASGSKLYMTNSNNGVRIGSTDMTWKVDNHKKTSGAFQFTSTTVSRFLGVYNNQDWRCYTTVDAGNFTNTTGSSAIYLYKKN